MKKFTLFLVPLMAISFLTGCGGQTTPVKHTVTFDSNGGTPVVSQMVEENNCAIEPKDPTKTKEGYTCSFIHWELDNAEFNFKTPIVKDITLVAKWQETINQYTVAVTSKDASKGTVSGGGTYTFGSTVTITATPSADYVFEGWYKDDSQVSTDASYSFSMPGSNVSYEAKFAGKPYLVTVTSEDTTKGTVSDGGYRAFGSSVTITAKPNEGFSFDGWYKGSSRVSQSESFTFIMPANDVSYLAKFYIETGPWYQRHDWWNYCSNGVVGEQAVAEDIGKEVDLTVNNQIHKVRLIDIDHDILNDDASKTAHCTFEFANLLSDANGYSIATLWNTSSGTTSNNYNYLNSDLRKALDGQGSGALRWYQIGAGSKSNTYTTSAYDMLPDDLKSNIKTVKKYIATTSSYTVNNYATNVFALTHNEMTTTSSSHAKEEGSTYQYYKDHVEKGHRIKYQVKWHQGALSDETIITDLAWHPYSYAGCNGFPANDGGDYWIASPHTNGSTYVWEVGDTGTFVNNMVYYSAHAVAPAFCI